MSVDPTETMSCGNCAMHDHEEEYCEFHNAPAANDLPPCEYFEEDPDV